MLFQPHRHASVCVCSHSSRHQFPRCSFVPELSPGIERTSPRVSLDVLSLYISRELPWSPSGAVWVPCRESVLAACWTNLWPTLGLSLQASQCTHAHLVRWDLIKFMLSLADPGAGCLLLLPIVDLCWVLKDNLPPPPDTEQDGKQTLVRASCLGIVPPKYRLSIPFFTSTCFSFEERGLQT